MCELPTMTTSPTTIGGQLAATWPSAGSMPTVPSAPVFFSAFQVSPGLAWRAGLVSLISKGSVSSTASGTSGNPSPSIRSTTPFLPMAGSGVPVFASRMAMW